MYYNNYKNYFIILVKQTERTIYHYFPLHSIHYLALWSVYPTLVVLICVRVRRVGVTSLEKKDLKLFF
jgi:hypothetical protein